MFLFAGGEDVIFWGVKKASLVIGLIGRAIGLGLEPAFTSFLGGCDRLIEALFVWEMRLGR